MSAALSGPQSPLAPYSVQASQVAELATVLLTGGALVFVVVLALAVCALRQHRPGWLRQRAFIIGGGLIFPIVVLSALFAYSLRIGYSLAEREPASLRLTIVGEMWWWRVHYLDAQGRIDFTTANEIHLPLDRAVEISLTSADVIHSFWMPGLSGMLDMIPGKVNTLRLSPRKAGAIRGQCTEFCGLQHARMAFQVQVSEAPAFEAWRAAQREPARDPQGDPQASGKQLFEIHCGVCHTVRGTAAAGVAGPDLTHVGSRRSLVAGMLPNNAGTIAGWIASSQHLKPGNRMPSFEQFTATQLNALASYVESLQ